MRRKQELLHKCNSNQKRLAVIGAVFGAILFYAHPLLAQLMVTPGKLDVNGLGGAVYSVPVEIPPGTAGMVPSVSLQYNSQGGDGPLGVGWSVTGLSEINRCGKTLVQDGSIGGVAFNSNDRFCLDGQRLVAISGTYGADGTEYRTEMESFSKIISRGSTGSGPAWWEVRTKSGQIMEYGNTSNSKAMLSGIASIKSWLVNKISDTKGNYLTYTYANNFTYNSVNTGEVLPSVIAYTGNAGATLSPYNSVEFVYATRPDISPMYYAGVQTFRTQRLTNIRTKTGTTLVGDYRLTYEQSPTTNQSRVASIAQCDGAGACLPSVSFSWTSRSGRGTFDQATATHTDSLLGTPPRLTSYQASGDFNGDGKTDTAFFYSNSIYAFLSQLDGTFQRVTTIHNLSMGTPPQGTSVPVTGDMNGDGRMDVLFFYNTTIRTFLSNGDGTYQTVTSSIPQAIGSPPSVVPLADDFNGDGKTDVSLFFNSSIYSFTSNGDGTYQFSTSTHNLAMGNPPSANYSPAIGDFNGDGRKDIAFFANTIRTFLNNGNGTYQAVTSSPPQNIGSPPSVVSLVDDLNGDGKTDVSLFFNSSIFTFMSNGDGTYQSTITTHNLAMGNPPSAGYAPAVGDFNGDGRKDMAFFANSIRTFLNKGDGAYQLVTSSPPQNMGTPPSVVPLAEDLDGDGKTDVSLFFNNSIFSFMSNGDGTYHSIISTHGFAMGNPPSGNSAPLTGDFNGDGYADIAFFFNSTRYTFLNKIRTPELIIGVNVSSFGSTTSLDYKPLTDSAVYTKGTGAVYPRYDFQAPVFVVSAMTSPNGIGGTYASTYKYAGAQFHVTGRGFLGFASQTSTDSQTGVIQTTNFRQDFPYIGKMSSQTKVLSGVTLNSETNTYSLGTLPWSGTYFPYLSQKVTTSKDLDGTAMPTTTTTYAYDTYGNATQVTNSTPDGASQTTNSTYTNDTINWHLGRLSGSSATNVTP